MRCRGDLRLWLIRLLRCSCAEYSVRKSHAHCAQHLGVIKKHCLNRPSAKGSDSSPHSTATLMLADAGARTENHNVRKMPWHDHVVHVPAPREHLRFEQRPRPGSPHPGAALRQVFCHVCAGQLRVWPALAPERGPACSAALRLSLVRG